MPYKLKFLPSALKEWRALDNTIKTVFKKKLRERLENPCIPAARLHGFQHHYKIKLRNAGYRLVYEVLEDEICVLVIAVGKRDKNMVYQFAKKRSEEQA